jgi:hypothetical protein
MAEIKKLKFNKEDDGTWYIDLPGWTGNKADLMMVSGADTLLDLLAENKRSVVLLASLEQFANAFVLSLARLGESEGGGHYFIAALGDKIINLEVWLCDVTRFVFGFIPGHIFLSVAEDDAARTPAN